MQAPHPLWQPFFDQAGVVILDGGLATELERRGADLRDPLWSAKTLLENPELIRQVHEDYFRAGADVGISASYQMSFDGFARRGLDARQAEACMRLSVQLAHEARERFWDAPHQRIGRCRPLIAASIGCYGATLHDGSEYRGEYGLSVRQLIDWHRPRLEILASCQADVLACETIPCLEEAEALVRLLEDFPEQPAWLSFSCRDDRRISQGEDLNDAIRIAQSAAHVVAVGVNCTPPQLIDGLLARVRGTATAPLLVYPNSGESWNGARQSWENAPASFDWSAAARRWRDGGAQLIGGCCRTTPATIRTIATALRRS